MMKLIVHTLKTGYMKQAMIVLTLWVLSQNALGQSTKLEGYSRNDAMVVSTNHLNPFINRQPLADINPHSFLTKTESAATGPVVQKARSAAHEKTSQDEVKALWANTKALEENTRALDENTKALKENTEMMRRLLESGQTKNVALFAKQQSNEQRMRSAIAISDQPAHHAPVFAIIPLEANTAVPGMETAAKPEHMFAATSLAPMAAHLPLPSLAPAGKAAVKKAQALAPVPAAVARIEKKEVKAVAITISTPVKQSSARPLISRSGVKPAICFLNSNSNLVENVPTPPVTKVTNDKPKAWAAHTTAKKQTSVAARVPEQKVAGDKAALKTNGLAATPAKMIVSHRSLSAKTATVSIAAKAKAEAAGTTAGPKIPLAAVMPKASAKNNLPSNPVSSKTAAGVKPIVPMVSSKMHLASALTKAPSQAGLPKAATSAATLGANNAAKEHVKKEVKSVEVPKHLSASVMVNNRVSASLPANQVTTKVTTASAEARHTSTANPKSGVNKLGAASSQPKAMPADMEAVVIRGAKPRSRAVDNRNIVSPLDPKATADAKASMSIAIETGMIGKKNKRVSLGYLLQFPLLERSYDNQLRSSKHMPIDVYSGFKEGDMVTTHGYISLISIEDSGKQNETYYIQLVVNPYKKDSCLNIRITADQFAGDARKKLTEHAREFVREQLLSGNTPSRGGNVMHSPVFVSITGQLVYNSALAGAMRGPHPLYIGKKGVRSYTPWEITNVNRIQFTR